MRKKELLKRIIELENRLTVLESRPVPPYIPSPSAPPWDYTTQPYGPVTCDCTAVAK